MITHEEAENKAKLIMKHYGKMNTTPIEFIAPQEPVYEWQWLESRNANAIFVDFGVFLTEDEAEKLKVANEYFYKIEWTKRVRT